MGALTIAVIVLASVEVGYFVKTVVWIIGSKLRSKINPFDPSQTYGKLSLIVFLTHYDRSFFYTNLQQWVQLSPTTM